MPAYLILTDSGIVTKPIVANTPAQLAAALAAAAGVSGKAAAIELTSITDVAGGAVPQAYTDSRTNADSLRTKGTAALTANGNYLASAAYPAGTALTTTQLTTIVRAQRGQIDLLTKQCNALIRLALGILDDVSNT